MLAYGVALVSREEGVETRLPQVSSPEPLSAHCVNLGIGVQVVDTLQHHEASASAPCQHPGNDLSPASRAIHIGFSRRQTSATAQGSRAARN